MDRYWTWWVLVTFPIAFGIPEIIALATGHTENTLSWWVWRHFQVIRHQPVQDWSASHFLFAITFIGIASWLVGHFVWGIWR